MNRVLGTITKNLDMVRENKSLLFIGPMIAFTPVGTICGMYKGYKCTSNKPYVTNVMATIGGMFVGTFAGAFMGLVWPISLPVFILRKYRNK